MTTWTDITSSTTGYKEIIRGIFYAGNREIYAGNLNVYAGYMSQVTWTDVSPDSTSWTDV